MGNGMMCITTLKTGVMQGDANAVIKGAAPPPPPTGAVGGGDALHLSAVVVMQVAPACLSQFPITPSGTQWVQVGAKCGRQCGPNAVTMRARCGRGAGSCFLSPEKIRGEC
ncbi:hypothetical protein SAMN06265173_1387 [Thalassovita litoralis]|uniref:Uncharacterized protein n=1 Tax=Thalassovita litoralis TaxID=1010611 RepID=A0A521FN88_9RHOB|nr:hypothetical protein SAMN06265173_1387 [Thalassovita litoralis]